MVLKLVELNTFRLSVQTEIIKTLEELLERAKKNEFESFAWATSLPNGDVKTGYTKAVDFHCQLAGVAMLQHRMIANRTPVEDEDT